MKKNITINLFGSLYCIDEDAYALLQKYTDSMKSYFARQEGGEEIADDIEHRVAELMWQKKEEGNEAIDIDMIKEIMAKIGNPAEIDGKEDKTEEKTNYSGVSGNSNYTHSESKTGNASNAKTESSSESNSKKWNLNNRHLYRNPKDKKLGGVCSGLAIFFNEGKDTGINDATFWRLGFLGIATLLFFYVPWWMPEILQCCVPIIYIILWIIMPEAKTPEDMLRMKGKNVTPENINEEILRESVNTEQNTTQAHAAYQQQQNNNSGCLKILFGGCLTIMLLPFLFVLFMLFIALVTVVGIGGGILGNLFEATPLEGLPTLLGMTKWPMLIGIVSVIFVLIIIVWLIIRWLRGSDKKMSTTSIVLCILGIILGLGCGLFGLLSSAGRFAKDAHIYINTTRSDWNDPDNWFDNDDDDHDDAINIFNDTLEIHRTIESGDETIKDTLFIPTDTIKAKINKEVDKIVDKLIDVKQKSDSIRHSK